MLSESKVSSPWMQAGRVARLGCTGEGQACLYHSEYLKKRKKEKERETTEVI